jgi:hypothetical protein
MEEEEEAEVEGPRERLEDCCSWGKNWVEVD